MGRGGEEVRNWEPNFEALNQAVTLYLRGFEGAEKMYFSLKKLTCHFESTRYAEPSQRVSGLPDCS